jgi:hypothetical protein
MKITIIHIIILCVFLICLKKNFKKEYFSDNNDFNKCEVDMKICEFNENSDRCNQIKKIYKFKNLPDNHIIFCDNYVNSTK